MRITRKLRRRRRSRNRHNNRVLVCEHLEDRRVLSVFSVVNTADSGAGSLRQAILDANANAGPDTINFNIPTSDPNFVDIDAHLPGGDADPDVFVIHPAHDSVVDDLTGGTTIDGWSQAAFGGETNPWGPEIVLDGQNGSRGIGISLRSEGNAVFGLNIAGFLYNNIEVAGAGGHNWIAGNYLGIDATGTTDVPYGNGAVLFGDGGSNLLGTNGDGVDDPLERNIISGRVYSLDNNIIAGNYIGTDHSGTQALSMQYVFLSGSNARLGTNGDGVSDVDERNVVYGAVRVSGNNNTIAGNYIGLDATGQHLLGTSNISLYGNATGNLIGTDGDGVADEAERNVIVGDGTYSEADLIVMHRNTSHNTVAGNFIGTNAAGTAVASNHRTGINLQGNFNVIGTNSDGQGDDIEGNLIAGSRADGIQLDNAVMDNIIAGNRIGTDITGTVALGNRDGVSVRGVQGNRIGTDGDGFADDLEANLIMGNRWNGVFVGGGAAATSIRGNSISENGRLGIELEPGYGGNGLPKPNDAGDADTGGNNLQNYPVITESFAGSSTRVIGTLNSTPLSTFTLDFYANTTADPSGYGEGERYLGAAEVTTDNNGNATFDVTLAAASTGGEFITSTATDSDGNTSEFSGNSFLANTTPTVNDQSFGLDENSSHGTVVGTTTASDPDLPGDTLNWSITGGNTGGAFAIDSATGRITVANKAALDFEINPSFDLTIRVEDSYGAFDEATVSIDLNDLQATVSILDAAVDEGQTGTMTLSLPVALTGDAVNVPFAVNYSAANGSAVSSGGGVAGPDYVASSGTVNFSGGSVNEMRVANVTVNADSVVELDETLSVRLSGLSDTNDVTIVNSVAMGTIRNDDVATVSISDSTVVEGGTLQHLVTLSNPVDVDTLIGYSTADGTATVADADYTAQANLVLIPAGTTVADRIIHFSHVGDSDPAAEGWRRVSLPGAPINDGGTLAWQMLDTSLDGLGYSFQYQPSNGLTPEIVTAARTQGWRMQFTTRVVTPNSGFGGLGNRFHFADGNKFWRVYVSMKDGNHQFALEGSSSVGGGRILRTIPGSGTGYVNFEVIYDPGTGTGRLLANGVTIAANWVGVSDTNQTPNINFGTDTGGTTEVRVAHVAFSTGSATIGIATIDNAREEQNETLSVNLTSVVAAGRNVVLENAGTGTIENDDHTPVADAGGPYAINEGDGFALNGSATDADSTTLTYRWDGDGDGDYGENITGATPVLSAHQMASLGLNDGPDVRVVTVEASDGVNVGTASTTLTIHNVAPDFDAGPDETLLPPVGGAFSRSGISFTDPGADAWSGTVNFGDSAMVFPLAINQSAKSFDLSHTYTAEGTFTVTVTVDDNDPGGARSDTFDVTVVLNSPPQIDPQSFSIPENGTGVGNVVASDPDLPEDTQSFSLTGHGPDDARFAITPGGDLSFTVPPDYESPTDMGGTPGDNVYLVEVQVEDSHGETDVALIEVSVMNQASITGTVIVDVNENGLYDANEPGIDGVLIELLDELGAPVLDDMGAPITATTSGGGFYLFEDLDPGVHQIFENQPTGVDDGPELLGSLSGTVVADDTMEVTLDHTDASDYVFAELGQEVTSGDTATIGFWQNKHGQSLIAEGGTALAAWLSDQFGNVFGDALAGADGADVASFYKEQLFKQKGKKSAAGPAKVDAQFMAVAFATYFTSSDLAGTAATGYGFNVTQTGIGTKVVNVGSAGAAFDVADGTDLTIMQLLLATNDLTDLPNGISGFAHIYDSNGDGVIDSTEAALRSMANDVYSAINEGGHI